MPSESEGLVRQLGGLAARLEAEDDVSWLIVDAAIRALTPLLALDGGDETASAADRRTPSGRPEAQRKSEDADALRAAYEDLMAAVERAERDGTDQVSLGAIMPIWEVAKKFGHGKDDGPVVPWARAKLAELFPAESGLGDRQGSGANTSEGNPATDDLNPLPPTTKGEG